MLFRKVSFYPSVAKHASTSPLCFEKNLRMSAQPNISDGFDQYLKNPLLKYDKAIIDLFLDPPGVSHTK